MRQARTITPTEMRMINRSAILDLVRRESPISRSVIAARLQVSLPTVMRITDALIKEGLVQPLETSEWSGGRRRSLLQFNGRNQMMIGVDMSGADFYGAVADLAGNVLVEISEGRGVEKGEAAYQRLVQMVTRLLKKAAQNGQNVRGIGVGTPGLVDYQRGKVLLGTALDWHEFALRERLVEHFALPVIVDNDVNLAALGEMWFGAGQNSHTLVMLMLGTGIGAGAVLDGAIYRGAHQAAGEIGYLPTSAQQLGLEADARGSLEKRAALAVMVEQARIALERHGEKVPALIEPADVLDAYAQGYAWAREALNDPLDALAIAVASLTLSFDPDVLVLGGELSTHFAALLPGLSARLDGLLPVAPRLEISRLGPRAGVMGAVVNVLHHTSDFYMLRSMA